MNIVFMGTPQFAVESLKKLYNNGYNIQLVVTQPDKPYGRGKKIKESEVKQTAKELDIEIFQPEKIKSKDSVNKIKELNPDLIVVIAYGQILSKEILDIPKYGCINVHASLLPKLRGAAPINWAIINGDKQTGVTTMLMDVGLDTGDMLLKEIVEIDENMDAGSLHDRLCVVGAEVLIKTINGIFNKSIVPKKQDNNISTYAPMLNKDVAKINWDDNVINIYNKVRGLNPDQVAYFTLEDKNVKVYKTEYIIDDVNEKSGTVKKVDDSGIWVFAKDGYVVIKELQMPGKNKMEVKVFLRGNKFPEGIELN